jgi:hypothetical protein
VAPSSDFGAKPPIEKKFSLQCIEKPSQPMPPIPRAVGTIFKILDAQMSAAYEAHQPNKNKQHK